MLDLQMSLAIVRNKGPITGQEQRVRCRVTLPIRNQEKSKRREVGEKVIGSGRHPE